MEPHNFSFTSGIRLRDLCLDFRFLQHVRSEHGPSVQEDRAVEELHLRGIGLHLFEPGVQVRIGLASICWDVGARRLMR